MAISKRAPTNIPGRKSAADLTAVTGGRFLTVDSNEDLGLTAAGGRIDCALEADAKPDAGQAVANGGPGATVKIEASAAITAGDSVSSAANGQARTAVSGDFIAGPALNSATGLGEVVSVHMTYPGIAP